MQRHGTRGVRGRILLRAGVLLQGTEGGSSRSGGTDEPSSVKGEIRRQTLTGAFRSAALTSLDLRCGGDDVPRRRDERVTSGRLRGGRGTPSALTGHALPPSLTPRVVLRSQATGDQVFMGDLPDGTRRLAPVPAGRTGGAVATLVGHVRLEHGAPAFGETRQFGAGYRDQGVGVGPLRQVGEHVEAFPHGITENLPKDLIHLELTVTFPPSWRLR